MVPLFIMIIYSGTRRQSRWRCWGGLLTYVFNIFLDLSQLRFWFSLLFCYSILVFYHFGPSFDTRQSDIDFGCHLVWPMSQFILESWLSPGTHTVALVWYASYIFYQLRWLQGVVSSSIVNERFWSFFVVALARYGGGWRKRSRRDKSAYGRSGLFFLCVHLSYYKQNRYNWKYLVVTWCF